MTNQPPIKVEASLILLKNLRNLRERYQRIQEDMQQVIQQLEQGELLGDQISGIDYPVFKLRGEVPQLASRSWGFQLN